VTKAFRGGPKNGGATFLFNRVAQGGGGEGTFERMRGRVKWGLLFGERVRSEYPRLFKDGGGGPNGRVTCGHYDKQKLRDNRESVGGDINTEAADCGTDVKNLGKEGREWICSKRGTAKEDNRAHEGGHPIVTN